jgi:hypothetical protein
VTYVCHQLCQCRQRYSWADSILDFFAARVTTNEPCPMRAIPSSAHRPWLSLGRESFVPSARILVYLLRREAPPFCLATCVNCYSVSYSAVTSHDAPPRPPQLPAHEHVQSSCRSSDLRGSNTYTGQNKTIALGGLKDPKMPTEVEIVGDSTSSLRQL